ncbi:hypothetical protein HDU96_003090 [Phlyctochytrium bullatum]|nr:hypothetical protein HDU96_003090 [Phlyctochytrium bullatum]
MRLPNRNREDYKLSNVQTANRDPKEQYWDAIASGDARALRSILNAKLLPADTGKDGLTGLHFACLHNVVDVVETLLDFGADPERKDADGKLPIKLSNSLKVWRALAAKVPIPQGNLFEAAKRGDDVSARLILALTMDPTTTLNEQKKVELKGWGTETLTPLHVVAYHGHAPVCEVFLQAGADVDGKDDWEKTPLMWAARQGYLHAVQLLIEKGANVNARDKNSKTPLHYAAWNGHVDTVRFLLDKGSDVNCRNNSKETPLILAAWKGDLNVVQLGADVNAADNSKSTPLMKAAEYGHLNVVQLLVERGADVHAKDQGGRTARDWALKERHIDVAEFLAPLQFPKKKSLLSFFRR